MAGRIRLKSMANFSKQAAVSLKAGLTLSRALPIITKDSRDPSLKRTMEEITGDIAGGDTLDDAVRKRARRFPPIFVEMVGAGERTGNLDEVFQRLADYFDMRLKLRRAVISACIYPAIQLFAALSVVTLIAAIFSADWVSTVKWIASIVIAAFAALVAAYLFFSRTNAGRGIWDRMVLMLPVFRGLTIKLCMTRFTRTLAMQIDSAIPMLEAVERAALVAGNRTITKSLKGMVEPLRGGSSLAEAVRRSRYVTPMIREVLVVGEETGNFSESLYRIAGIYEEEAMAVLETMPKFIGPIVTIIVGIVVVFLFYFVYFKKYLGPMMDMVGG